MLLSICLSFSTVGPFHDKVFVNHCDNNLNQNAKFIHINYVPIQYGPFERYEIVNFTCTEEVWG